MLKYGLLGKTLKHSYSKLIHEQMGRYEYDLISVDESELENVLKNEAYGGFNVTIPYKQVIIPHCTKISDSARKIGSVNTVVRQKNGDLYGYNTDYDGFSSLLEANGIELNGKKVVILGSGGTFKTAYAVCTDMCAREVLQISRSGKYNYNNVSKWNDAEVIINTTPVGMYPNGGASLINLDLFPKCRAVADVVYNPLKTKLVFDAQERGIKAVGGLYMLVKQAQRAFELFTGEELSDEVSDKVYKNLLTSVKNIVLIGMPGSGKTTIGARLAEELHRDFIDIDAEIVKGEGLSIPEIFERSGEKGFRELEVNYTRSIGAMTGKVISAGGGVVLNKINKYCLAQNGEIFCIERDISQLATDGRPLSKGIDELKSMYLHRKPLYEDFCDMLVDNNSLGTDNAVNKIMEEFLK